MKNLSLISKICFGLGFLSIITSIVISFVENSDPTWKIIALFWMLSALVSDLRINQLEGGK